MPIARLGAADAAAARRVLSAAVLRVGAPGGGGAGAGAPGLPAVAPLHMGLDFWAGQGEGCAASLDMCILTDTGSTQVAAQREQCEQHSPADA